MVSNQIKQNYTIIFPLHQAWDDIRHVKPWIAKVTAWRMGNKPKVEHGRYHDNWRLEIEAVPGDVIRWGKKDCRRPSHSEVYWGITQPDGIVLQVKPAEAWDAWELKKES